jgi:hypothetical protein
MSGVSKKYFVIKEYLSPYPDPIHFKKGVIVDVGETYKGDPDWADWVWCTGKNKSSAWVPKQYIHYDSGQWVLKTEFNAMEISVDVGDCLDVYEIVNGFGMAEKPDGKRGWVPMKHLQQIGDDWQ